jgi:hypothetical protein
MLGFFENHDHNILWNKKKMDKRIENPLILRVLWGMMDLQWRKVETIYHFVVQSGG